MTTIMIADDHAMFREGLAQMLTQAGMHVIAECSNGNDVHHLLTTLHPDVLLLDVSMPGSDGIAVAELITADTTLRSKIIILTMYNSEDICLRAQKAGVAGYLLKDCAFSEVITAIETVMSGCRHISAALRDCIYKSPPTPARDLTKREREILRHIASGLTAKEMSERLFISPKTVDVHRTNIMKKLDVHSTASLVSYAHKAGLL